MKPSVLWIDDVPEEGVFFRASLIKTGIDLFVANSVIEAHQRIANSEYDAFVLRPDIKISGEPYYRTNKNALSGAETLAEVYSPNNDNQVPFLNDIYYELRHSKLNNGKLLYIATFNREVLKAVEEGFFTKDFFEQSNNYLTKLVYMGEERPSQFAYNLEEEILARQLAKYKIDRLNSRTDG